MSDASISEEKLLDWVVDNLPPDVDTTRARGAQPFDGILSLLDEAASAGKLPRIVKSRIMQEYVDPEDRELFDFYPTYD